MADLRAPVAAGDADARADVVRRLAVAPATTGDRSSAPILLAMAPAGPSYGDSLGDTRGLRRYTPRLSGEMAVADASLPPLLFPPSGTATRFDPPATDERFANVIDASLQADSKAGLGLGKVKPMPRTEMLRAELGLGQPILADRRPRIVVHFNPLQAPAEAHLAAAMLRARGFGPVELRAVDFDVPETSARFFHGTDRALAHDVRGILAPNLRSVVERDFTHFAPRPDAGLIEVWISG